MYQIITQTQGGYNKMESNEYPYKSVESYLFNTFNFFDEQLKSLEQETEMTQEMFSSILDRCLDIRINAGRLFFRMLREYPSFNYNVPDSYLQEQETQD